MVVVPTAIADTKPVLFTVATELLLLLQVPPVVPVGLLRLDVFPAQADKVPVMAPATGKALTVNAAVAVADPHEAVFAV